MWRARGKAKEAARTRDRQAAASQDEAEENDATEEEVTRERTTRVGRPRGGMKVAARIGERLRREIGRGRRPRVRVGDGEHHTPLLKIPVCVKDGRESARRSKTCVVAACRPSSHPSLGLSVLFLLFFLESRARAVFKQTKKARTTALCDAS